MALSIPRWIPQMTERFSLATSAKGQRWSRIRSGSARRVRLRLETQVVEDLNGGLNGLDRRWCAL